MGVDLSLEDYVAVKTKSAQFVPHTAGRFQAKRFRKAQCPIVERLVNSIMMHRRDAERNVRNGKNTGKNPIQVLVEAIEKSGPREATIAVGNKGTRKALALDVSPLYRVSQALKLLAIGAREASFRKIKSVSESLADELINASEGSQDSYAVRAKKKIEEKARSSR